MKTNGNSWFSITTYACSSGFNNTNGGDGKLVCGQNGDWIKLQTAKNPECESKFTFDHLVYFAPKLMNVISFATL